MALQLRQRRPPDPILATMATQYDFKSMLPAAEEETYVAPTPGQLKTANMAGISPRVFSRMQKGPLSALLTTRMKVFREKADAKKRPWATGRQRDALDALPQEERAKLPAEYDDLTIDEAHRIILSMSRKRMAAVGPTEQQISFIASLEEELEIFGAAPAAEMTRLQATERIEALLMQRNRGRDATSNQLAALKALGHRLPHGAVMSFYDADTLIQKLTRC